MNIKLKLFLFSIFISFSSLSFAVDTDRDTLPDDWEIANGRDPLVADYIVSGIDIPKGKVLSPTYT